MTEFIGRPEEPSSEMPEMVVPPQEIIDHLGDTAMRGFVEGEPFETSQVEYAHQANDTQDQDQPELISGAAAMLGVDEKQIASDIFGALVSGEDMLSLYDRWYEERPADGMQGPLLPPSMLEKDAAKQLGFEDVKSMTAAAAYEHHILIQQELQQVEERRRRGEGDEGEVKRTGKPSRKSKKAGSVTSITAKRRDHSRDMPNSYQEAA